MRCGVCGGGIRGYSGVLHGRPIRDWKHTDVPDEWRNRPHRPILGTPVDKATLDRIHRPAAPEEEKLDDKLHVEPLALPRPATSGELAQCSSAENIIKLATAEGWAVMGAPTYLQTRDATEYLVIKVRRRDLGAVGVWRRRPNKNWEFDEGWTRTCRGILQVGSNALKTWLKQRDEECPDCGASSAAHPEECAA